jgi:3-oxoadipate enol-lactonase
MAFLELNGGRTHYELSGASAGRVLMFSNSLGTNLGMWDLQAAELAASFRILRYDTRGHGQSEATPGPYTIERLADDVLALLDQLGIRRVNFCGLSMGGIIGMLLALRAPERLEKLVLCNTAATIGSAETWNARIAAVRRGGIEAVADAVLERWYTAGFRAADPAAIAATRAMLVSTPVEGYASCCAALRDADLREVIAGIGVPTLIVVGAHDPVTTLADGRFMAERIKGSKCVELPAAHLSNIEAADAFTMELSGFLKG